MIGTSRRVLVAAFLFTLAACTATDTAVDPLQARCTQLDAQAVTEPTQTRTDAAMRLFRDGVQFGDVPCGQECVSLLSSGAVRSLTMLVTVIGAYPVDDTSSINHIVNDPGYWRLTSALDDRCRTSPGDYGTYVDGATSTKCVRVERVGQRDADIARLQVRIERNYTHDDDYAYAEYRLSAFEDGRLVFRRASMQRSRYPQPMGIPTGEGACASFPHDRFWSSDFAAHIVAER